MVGITDVRKSLMERSSDGSGGFDGVKIPFLSLVNGKTNLLFLSDLDIHESDIPPVTFYHYYKPAKGYTVNGKEVWEIAYKPGDTLEPNYVASKKKEGKEPNPSYFPYKGFAYVVNLTALKAVQLFLERGGDENTNVDVKSNPIISSKDFGKDPEEAKAAKGYLKQYQAFLKNVKKNEENEVPEFHGIYIYNFNVSITRGIGDFIDTLESDGYEISEVHMPEWVFTLSKGGEGLQTEYSFSINYPVEELSEDLVAPTYKFLDENEALSDFSGLIDRKRYKTDDDELDEEFKVSTMADEAEEW